MIIYGVLYVFFLNDFDNREAHVAISNGMGLDRRLDETKLVNVRSCGGTS
jgi:hypothetical protein